MPTLGVSPLYAIAKKACIKNIQSITDVGDIPYDYLRPILIKISNPDQLRELEIKSPQLQGADEEIWLDFIKRDVQNGEAKLEETGRKASYKMWRRLSRADKEAMDRDADELAKQMKSIQDAAAARTSKIVDASKLPRLPRLGGMRVEKSRSTVRHSGGDSSVLSFTSGSRTRTTSGQGVVNKSRREAKEMSLFSARKSALIVPTHQLSNKAGGVRSVPKAMVTEHGQEIESRRPKIIAPRGTSHISNSSQKYSAPDMAKSPQPRGGYRIPRQGFSGPEGLAQQPVKSRPPADPFMPHKRRRV